MKRYAVYYAPPAGEFAARAAHWLGRDAETGARLAEPDLGLPAAEITTEPRRYGFHGTLKPPFRLAEGQHLDGLHAALVELARDLKPLRLDGLRLAALGGFLALIPEGDVRPLQDLAAQIVTRLDAFRAPLNPAEIARRRPERLSARQRELLELWGYPFVLEEFRFHLTLTDRLPPDLTAKAEAALAEYFIPVLPRPFTIDDICLFGETEAGVFRLLHRYALTG